MHISQTLPMLRVGAFATRLGKLDVCVFDKTGSEYKWHDGVGYEFRSVFLWYIFLIIRQHINKATNAIIQCGLTSLIKRVHTYDFRKISNEWLL